MRVIETKKDFMLMPKGSVCEVIKELKDDYRVLWCSMNGSYEVLIPKSITKSYKNELEKLIKNKDFITLVNKFYGTGKK